MIVFIESLGPRFNLPYHGWDGEKVDLFRYFVVFERMKDSVLDFMSWDWNILRRVIERFLKECACIQFPRTMPSKAIVFIKLQVKRTRRSMARKPSVLIFSAGECGKVVLTDHHVYEVWNLFPL